MKRWTPDEVAFLKSGYQHNRPVRIIASHLGRTRNEVIGKAHRLGLRHGNPNRRPWTAEDIDRLSTMWASGETGPVIAKTLNRTTAAVWQRVQFEGLPRHRPVSVSGEGEAA